MYNLTEERIGVDLNNKETEKEIQRERIQKKQNSVIVIYKNYFTVFLS